MGNTHRFTANGLFRSEMLAEKSIGYSILVYSGNLGGGKLAVSTELFGVITPVADAKLSATVVDKNGDVVKQITFVSAGVILIELSGATSPDVTVAFQ